MEAMTDKTMEQPQLVTVKKRGRKSKPNSKLMISSLELLDRYVERYNPIYTYSAKGDNIFVGMGDGLYFNKYGKGLFGFKSKQLPRLMLWLLTKGKVPLE